MVVIEVGSAVLHHAKGRYSVIGHGGDVGSRRITAGLEDGSADTLEHTLHRPESLDGGRRGFDIKADRMGGSGIALDGGDVANKIGRVFAGVGFAARAAGFLIHPGDDSEGAGWGQVEALENFGSLHGDNDTGAVVDRAGAEIPGIEMSGDDDDLLGVLGTFKVRNDVVAGLVGKPLRSEGEMHADFALRGEVDDEIGIFGRHSAGRDPGGETVSSVGKAVVGVAERSDQGGDGTEICTDEGKLHLASVLDVASRRVLGFALSEHHDAELAYGALAMAVAVRGGHVPGVIMHTDQGSEYTARLFRAACERLSISQSMGRPGSALDNAVIESWHSTVEFELRRVEHFATRAQARARVAAWIEDYNHNRRHSACAMMSPVAWELAARREAA